MQSKRNGFVYSTRAYYEDTDASGLVYNGSYVRYMERARTEWLRHIGYEQRHLMDDMGIVFVVRRIEVDYLAPAHLDATLTLHTRLVQLGKVSMTFEQQVWWDDTLICKGLNKVACIAHPEMRPTAIPDALYQHIKSICHPPT